MCMNAEETVASVVDAVSGYQAAKVKLALIEERISRVASAYRTCGNSLNDSLSNSAFARVKVENGTLQLVYGDIDQDLLLNAQELVALLTQRIAAQERRNRALEAMKAVGITAVI